MAASMARLAWLSLVGFSSLMTAPSTLDAIFHVLRIFCNRFRDSCKSSETASNVPLEPCPMRAFLSRHHLHDIDILGYWLQRC